LYKKNHSRNLLHRAGLEISMSSQDRYPGLDGLRAISIMLVLACHMVPLGPSVLRLNFAAGALGMSIFFSLSGFLITSSLLHNASVFEFALRRVARIVPLLYLYLFVVSAIGLVHFDNALLTSVFLINYFTQFENGFTAHLWSLCVEMHFYLAIGAVVLIIGQRGIWVVWPTCILVTLLKIKSGNSYPYETHLRLDELLVGSCIATIYPFIKERTSSVIFVLIAAIMCAVAASPFAGWAQYIRCYAVATLMASVLCHSKTWLSRFLASRAMTYVASISYALYVIHMATVQGWMREGDLTIRVIKRLLSFLITFSAASLSKHWEMMWQTLAKNVIRRRRQNRVLAST
jgi:peptidoglycan/LPS O-acetylase OafA/YrhL